MRIAVVDDSANDLNTLSELVHRYSVENGLEVIIDKFLNANEFLDNFSPIYDIIFMDIEMGVINGLEAAKKLRELDSHVLLIFVTNHIKYAIKGYEVNAMAYVLKPVNYESLSLQLNKCLELIRKDENQYLEIKIAYGMLKIPINGLRYIEVYGHQLIFSTCFSDITTRGRLSEYAKILIPHGFYRCNRSVIVNKKYIEQIKGRVVVIGNKEFYISKSMKDSFLNNTK